MGDEISKTAFTERDFQRFGARLSAETALACDWLRAGRLSEQGFAIGFELEAWLLDHASFPHPVNERFLRTLDHPLVVPELSRFNVELNCTPQPLRGYALRSAEAELEQVWAQCNAVAHGLDANMVMIGTLPTIRNEDLSLDNMSPLKRYYALNSEVLRQRGGEPIRIDISGRERLSVEHKDVMLEAATTSFQVHLKTPAHLAQDYFNASLIASGPVLAVSGNAPFLFGKSLWDETRIPLFEQAVSLSGMHEGVERVTFGRGYLDSPTHWLRENLEEYPVLLPLCFEDPARALRHVRLHNGTIWRWNRPLLGFEEDGAPHIRIEHRILPAGPTFIDMMANAALYIGLVHYLVSVDHACTELDFSAARANFYKAARSGLSAELSWPGLGTMRADRLLAEVILGAARRGLEQFGVHADDSDRYLDVIAGRIRSGQTGAAWQRACLHARTGDWFELMATYCERQRSGAPVHQWDL